MVLEETEKELVGRCQHVEGGRADSDAFRALFERYKDRVYSIALRYSGDPAVAQDITQDTFLKLFAGIGTFRGDANFDSWLYRLVVNACFDQKRKTRRLLPLVEGRRQRAGRRGASGDERRDSRCGGDAAARTADGDCFAVHAGSVVRGDCRDSGLPGRHYCLAAESCAQDSGAAVVAMGREEAWLIGIRGSKGN